MAPSNELEGQLLEIVKECEQKVEGDPKNASKRCSEKGTLKHACCDEKVQKMSRQDLHSDSAIDSKTGNPITKKNTGSNPTFPKKDFPQVPRTRTSFLNSALFLSRGKGSALRKATVAGFMRGKFFPDLIVTKDPTKLPGPSNVATTYDFKFPCPPSKRPKWGKGGFQKRQIVNLLNPQTMPKLISPAGFFH